MTTFVSKLMGANVLDAQEEVVGRLKDLVIQQAGERMEVVGVVVRRGRQTQLVGAEAVLGVNGHIKLRNSLIWPGRPSPLNAGPPVEDDDQFRLIRDVLDAQVIDMNGAKVIRVNDIQLDWMGDRLIVSGLDIGPWGLCRRLGIAPLFAYVIKTFHLYINEGIVPLSEVTPLSKGLMNLQLQVPKEQIHGMHPADLAIIVAELGHEHRHAILSTMSVEQTADLVEESDANIQKVILQDLGEDRAADVLDAMQPDEAADLLSEVSEEDRDRLMQLMEPEGAETVRELMRWSEGTAGALMNTNFWCMTDDMTVGQAIARVRSGIPLCEEVLHVYVVDVEQHLQGVAHLRRMLAATDDTRMREVMDADADYVLPTASETEIRQLMSHYHILAVPVVDETRKLLGVVTIYDIMDILFPEAEH